MAQQKEGLEEKKESETNDGSQYQHLALTIKDNKNKSMEVFVKDNTSKRVFAETFTRSRLKAMTLQQPIRNIIQMINAAKSGKKQKVDMTFFIGYYPFQSQDINKKSTKKDNKDKPKQSNNNDNNNDDDYIESLPTKDELKHKFNKGDAMYIVLSIDEFFMSGEYVFRLIEQERAETEILTDRIEDLEAKIKKLEQEKKELEKKEMNPIAIYKSNKAGHPINWDVVGMANTLQGLTTRESSNRYIKVGFKGIYKITIRFGWSSSSGSSYTHTLLHNGNKIATVRAYYDPVVYMDEILQLNAGDQLEFSNGGSYTSWDYTYNFFRVELLKPL